MLPFVAEQEQCHLCRHRQPLQSCPLLSGEGFHLSSSVGGVVYRKSCVFAWHPKEDQFRQGQSVHLQVLAGLPKGDWYDSCVQYRVSPQTSGQVERVNQILE